MTPLSQTVSRDPLRYIDQRDCADCLGAGAAVSALHNGGDGRCMRCGGAGRIEMYVDDRDGELYTQRLGFR